MKTIAFLTVAAAAASCGAELAPGRFTHEMPTDTNMKPTNPAYAEMAADFANPFGKVTTGCYWYWIGGNLSCDGVRKDLEAMKRGGIERAYIGDINGSGNAPGPVKTLSPEWEKVMATAFETASRLGIEIGIFNSPGWSQSGGPWVKPEQAMRRLVSSSVVVTGPQAGVKLPAFKFESAPVEDARDILAVAYPAPTGFTDRLETKDVNDSLLQVDGKTLAVELSSPTPFTAQSAEFAFCDGAFGGKVKVEVEENGSWRTVCEMPCSRVNHATNVGFAPHAPILASFPAVTAKKFRLSAVPGYNCRSRFATVAVCGAPLVARAYEKTLGKMFEAPLPMWTDYQWPQEPANAAGTALDPAKAVVLKDKVAKDGTLDWQVPAGTWVVYRFGAAPTGTKNGPANPEVVGYEVDKMSREHVAMHFDAYLGKILARTPEAHRKAIRHTVLDSYEQGGQNYTDDFAARFKASFGYDPTPYLPSVFGMPAASRDASDRFLWDLRRFVADEVAYSYVGGLRAASNRHGLSTWLECYGHWGFPGEFLQYGGQSDGIGGEFWSEGTLGDIENRAASSCGHIYGKRIIWAESNTCGGPAFSRTPMDLKSRTDRFFADGINGSILHLYIHQETDRAPGRIAWFGNEFNRHNTWFEHFDLFTGYLKRTGYLLQQGLNVADVAYFIGEDVPKMTGIAEPCVPRGSQFDYINGEVLRETTGVDAKGRLVLPHGTAYEVLVLPTLETMRPELLARLEQLVHAGAFVMGPKPKRSPSLAGQPQSDAKVKEIADRLWGEVDGKNVKYAKRGKGTIAWGLSIQEVFNLRKIETDLLHDGRHHLIHAHRTLPNAELYFVAVFGGKPAENAEASFRVSGRVPEIWDPYTGERREADQWRFENGRTVVNFSLAQHGSTFVVFAKDAAGRTGATRKPTEATAVAGPWTLAFQSDKLHRGPANPVTSDKLFDLSTSADPAVKYYSGKVVYTTKFSVASAGARTVLDLGEVAVTAKVKVNGQDAGGVCFAPYRLDVTKFVKPGENALEVEVCNLWVNRLIGDADVKDRPTWTSLPCYGKNGSLRKSGLIGPVRILVTREPVEELPAGDTVLSQTRVLGAEASGKTFRGAADGSTRIRGGVAISGWTDRGDGVWGAKLPKGADGKPIYGEMLFVNGRRAQRSRFPADGGFFRVTSARQIECAASVTGNRVLVGLDADAPAMKLLAATPKDELAHAQLLTHVKWDVARSPLADVTPGQLAVDAQKMLGWMQWGPNDFYALENVRGAFREPGQWFYDAKAGEVLYRPLAGEKIREAILPTDGLEVLLAVRGAKNVVFENVTFAFSAPTSKTGATYIGTWQAAAPITQAAVTVDDSTDVVFRNCRFEHLGSYAVWFREGCRGGGAFGCEMTDLGAGGVRIGTMRSVGKPGVTQRPENCTSDVAYVETAPWMTSHVSVEDCAIAHGGRFHPAGVGVLLTHASDCSIVHNDIFDLFYTGVSVGWIWGYAGSPSQRNTVAFNHIRDIGQGKLADMGGVYLLGTAFGTCVSNNVIHGIHTYSYGGWGLYPDEGSEGLVLENNLVYDTDDASFHQHYGKDNVLRNNILVDSKAGQIAVSRIEPHRSLTVERNIVIWTKGDAFVRYAGTKSEKAKIDWRNNVWWRTDGKDVFNATSFAEWRTRVKDEGSVFADPGFADWKEGDFALKSDSPAYKVGFRPFDPSRAGRRMSR